MSRTKLLFVCQNLPYPPDGGALIRSFHTLRMLSNEYEVTAICFYRRSSRPSEASVAEARQELQNLVSDIYVFPIDQETSDRRMLWDHVRSVVTLRAYTHWTYANRKCARRIRDLMDDGGISVVHLDSLDLSRYLPLMTDTPVVVAHHNVESQLLARRAEMESGLRRLYIRFQAALMRKEERTLCPSVALNVTVSQGDAETLSQIAPNAKTVVAENGVDTSTFTPTSVVPERKIVFVGGYTWFPNRDGMEHFAANILPLIRREAGELPVTWVGRANPEVIARMRREGVYMTGYVDDVRPYVSAAACVIVPLRVGGGTRLKILDAWAMGKAVVATSAGAEGLMVRPGENILIADGDQAFANAVLAVLNDQELRGRLEREARRTALTRYDWSVIEEKLLQGYRKILSGV